MNRSLAAVSVWVVLLTACTHTTESTQVGVRTSQVGVLGARGVQPDVQLPGTTQFFLNAIHTYNTYEVNVRSLVMQRENSDGRGDDSIRFKTIDGNDVSVNVTVQWSIIPDRAPYLQRFVGATTDAVEEKLVRPVSRSILRDVLNQLSSEAYYQAERRYEMAEEARARLNMVLEQEGVLVDQIQLGEHRFNDTYEQIIRDKKLSEQEAERIRSETAATRQAYVADRKQAEGESRKVVAAALGAAEKRRLEADAEFYKRQKLAEAIRAEMTARAEGIRSQVEAMSGPGGRIMVKRRLAQALADKRILFVPAGEGMDLRTTDVNALLETLGTEAAANQ